MYAHTMTHNLPTSHALVMRMLHNAGEHSGSKLREIHREYSQLQRSAELYGQFSGIKAEVSCADIKTLYKPQCANPNAWLKAHPLPRGALVNRVAPNTIEESASHNSAATAI